MNKIRSHRGVVPYHLLIAVFGITLATFLLGTGVSFSGFHNLTEQANKWDTASLATATVVANSSSNMVQDLEESIVSSINNSGTETICRKAGYTETIRTRIKTPCPRGRCITRYKTQNIYHPPSDCYTNHFFDRTTTGRIGNIHSRAAMVRAFANEMLDSSGLVRKTIDYGLASVNNIHKDTGYQLIHSDFFNLRAAGDPARDENAKKYASTMLKNHGVKEIPSSSLRSSLLVSKPVLNLDSFGNVNGSSGSAEFIRMSSALFNKILDRRGLRGRYAVFNNRPEIIGIELVNNGIDFGTLPNGVKLDLTTIDRNKKAKSLTKVATAQLALERVGMPPAPEPPPPNFCPTTGRRVTLLGECKASPGKLGCPCYCDELTEEDCTLCGTGCKTTKAPAGGSNGGTDKDEEDDLDTNILINIKAIPAPGKVEIIFDATAPASKDNPIITRHIPKGGEGGSFFGIFPTEGKKDITVFIGNNYDTCKDDEPANTGTEEEESKESASISGEEGDTEVDVLTTPMGWVTVSTVPEDIEVNGIPIPKGTIVFATADSLASIKSQSKTKSDFSSVSFYDPNNDGEEIAKVKAKDLSKEDWQKINDFHYKEEDRKIACTDADGNPTGKFGGKIHTEFNLSNIFPGLSPEEAIKAFGNIKQQRSDDRQLKVIANGNSKDNRWSKVAYRGMSQKGKYAKPSVSINLVKAAEKILGVDLQADLDKAIEDYKAKTGRDILRPSDVERIEEEFLDEMAIQHGDEEAIGQVRNLMDDPKLRAFEESSDPIRNCMEKMIADAVADFEDARSKRDTVDREMEGFKKGSLDYNRLKETRGGHNTTLKSMRKDLEAMMKDFSGYRRSRRDNFTHPASRACK